MIWILIVAGLLVTLYCFFVISGENVYRVTYHDPDGKEWELMVSASGEREALKTAGKVIHEGTQIVEIREEL